MAVVYNKPFPPGFRLVNCDTLNAQLANPVMSSESGITATASGTQATSYQLGAAVNRISTVATAADGVKLPRAQPGMEIFITNAGANAAQVFGTSPDTIDGVATATGVSQPAGTTVAYRCVSVSAGVGAWISTITGTLTTGAQTIAGAKTFSTMPIIPSATVAAAGNAQGNAAAVTTGFTLVTAADGTKGVILPTAVAGLQVIIKNGAAAVLKIYPATSDAINAIAANGSLDIASLTSVYLVAFDATTWYSIPLLPS